MERVNIRNLKKGQIVLVGEVGVGKFEVAEVKENVVNFKNWDKIDMNKGEISSEMGGEVSHKTKGCMIVLNSKEIKEVEAIKNKIKMLDSLEERNKEERNKS